MNLTKEQIQEIVEKRAESIENFIACYLVETGLKIDEIVLVEEHCYASSKIKWYCEPKSKD
jgi:hypothetical protein